MKNIPKIPKKNNCKFNSDLLIIRKIIFNLASFDDLFYKSIIMEKVN